MFRVAMNKMYLTRGDTARFSIGLAKIAGVTQDYELSEDDRVYFIVTECPEIVDLSSLGIENSACVFYKEGIDIIISPEDTMYLDGELYYYQVRVVLKDTGDVNTIIEPSELILTPVGG